MRHKDLYAPLGLIDPTSLRGDEEFLLDIDYEMFSDKKVGLYIKKGNYLVCHKTYWSKLKKIWRFDQQEFPIESLPWIIDRFENGFLKCPEDGGLPADQHSVSIKIADENIRINAMMHCCAENLFGYAIRNFSRASYINNDPPQEWSIPRYMLLDHGLLDELKKIAADHAPSNR